MADKTYAEILEEYERSAGLKMIAHTDEFDLDNWTAVFPDEEGDRKLKSWFSEETGVDDEIRAEYVKSLEIWREKITPYANREIMFQFGIPSNSGVEFAMIYEDLEKAAPYIFEYTFALSCVQYGSPDDEGWKSWIDTPWDQDTDIDWEKMSDEKKAELTKKLLTRKHFTNGESHVFFAKGFDFLAVL